jgi:hypothetical protein
MIELEGLRRHGAVAAFNHAQRGSESCARSFQSHGCNGDLASLLDPRNPLLQIGDLGQQLGILASQLRLHITKMFLHSCDFGQRLPGEARLRKNLQAKALLLGQLGLGGL